MNGFHDYASDSYAAALLLDRTTRREFRREEYLPLPLSNYTTLSTMTTPTVSGPV